MNSAGVAVSAGAGWSHHVLLMSHQHLMNSLFIGQHLWL